MKRFAQLTWRRLGLWFIPGALFGERAHQVHEVPAYFFRGSVAFAGHLPLTVAHNPKKFAIGHLLDGRSVAPVAEFKLHVRGEVTLTVATFAVTHRAIVAKKLAYFRQSLRRRRDRILFGDVFRRHFWLCGCRLFLRGIRLRVGNPETREQNRTQDEERPMHSSLLTGGAGRVSEFGLI